MKVLKELFLGENVGRLFNPSFLDKVPIDQIHKIILDIVGKSGKLEYVEEIEDNFYLFFERAKISASVIIDNDGKISGLWFGTTELKKSTAELFNDIKQLPGITAISIYKNGVQELQHNSDMALSVGSTAKIAVLAALNQAIREKKFAWDDIVLIKDQWRSVPSGILQDWPIGCPITIASLANLMISISDNTATDALIEIVGRASVELISPYNTPFISTRELIYLKEAYGSDSENRWASSNEEDKRMILNNLSHNKKLSIVHASKPSPSKAGWQMSTTEIYRLLQETSHLPAMRINPGLAKIRDWEQISFKGGSDIGVLNFSSHLIDNKGNNHTVIATWNDNGILKEDKLVTIYKSILSNLAS